MKFAICVILWLLGTILGAVLVAVALPQPFSIFFAILWGGFTGFYWNPTSIHKFLFWD